MWSHDGPPRSGNGNGNGNGGGRGRVLVTGGAGFVGSHLADELLRNGYRVRALDNLDPQVHGDGGRPAYLDPEVELLQGDVRDADAVARALDGVDAVVHLAAAVGVGQSMYQIRRYAEINTLGTAVLLQALAERPVQRLVVASSMSIYGEGLYADADGSPREVAGRSPAQLAAGRWDVEDVDGLPLAPVPTPERKTPAPASVYALGKYDQERLCLTVGGAYGVPSVALRFFNIYGTRQALSNPYTGVLAIFASRYLNGKPPLVYEDGRQRRDFVHVSDVARACRLALERPGVDGEVFNIGSGESITVLEVAAQLARALGIDGPPPRLTGEYRVGDIRHCFADIAHARALLGYAPEVPLARGLEELVGWMTGQPAFDRVDDMRAELARRGLQR